MENLLLLVSQNVAPANICGYVDIVMAAVTAQMEASRRAREKSNVEQAPAPVTATVVDPV